MTELSTRFNFKEIEDKWCRAWEERDLFHAKPSTDKPAYSIVIPPPNVTGILHMGHALNNTLQDILIRYKRMKGFETCWMPGTDHAGIATQNVVEKQLAKEGKTRHDIGRDEMLKRLWAWKDQYGDTIINQLKKLGASCDWPRARFTMDKHYSDVVRYVFVHLYKKGLVYRGEYIINWCPRCQTALSDEEAEHREQQGALYHIQYPLKDGPGKKYVTVATTRPETMLGDTAVAVNPEDGRYKDLIGKTLVLPLVNREIPVIADAFVDPQFGTGAVKVTPAHDPNDFAIGQRHKLPAINIMRPDGVLNENAGDFSGMDRFEAREAIIATLRGHKLLAKIDEHTHAVGHCYRCHTVVEPYLSRQWFVKMKPLAEPAVRVVTEGRVKFYPERWTKVYLNWMENIRDWCISRQIWWGHRIPAWYCDAGHSQDPGCREPIVGITPPKQCPHCGSNQLRQDDDVLDTWFSSWLWPFATFGWPENDTETGFFYPTNALFTASEIIFFWVARMIMAGLEFVGDIPFSEVYIHGTVRDAQGRKMSKSLGNAIDPLEIIEEYGADALRFSLIVNSGQDLYISKEKFEIGRNFANKIWNASRLVLMNAAPDRPRVDLAKDVDWKKADLASRWIVSRFYSTCALISQAIENFRFSEAETLLYDFVWGNYCDWYLEIIKNRLDDPAVRRVAFGVLERTIRMIHPFMPYVTEEIWAHLGLSADALAHTPWPEQQPALVLPDVEKNMQTVIDVSTTVRNLKSRWGINPRQEVDCTLSVRTDEQAALLESNRDMLIFLLKLKNLVITKKTPRLTNTAVDVAGVIKVMLPLGDLVDLEAEKKKIARQVEQLKKDRSALAARLKNPAFTGKAPAHVVEKEKARLDQLDAKGRELQAVIQNLQ